MPIIALTPLTGTARRLALTWGLHCVVVPEVDRFKMAVVSAARAARDHGFAGEEDRIVVTAGIPFGVAGSTNILRVAICQRAGDLRGRRRGLSLVPAPLSDRRHWSRAARDWIEWARRPGHDAFWSYRKRLAELIGPGRGEALDVGCGEGRVSRLLRELGWRVTAADAVEEMVAAAREAGSAHA